MNLYEFCSIWFPLTCRLFADLSNSFFWDAWQRVTLCHMEDSNMDTAGLCRTRFVWHVARFDSSRSRLGLKMRIRIHLSTCSGDEDRTVLDLQIGKWQTGLTEISPREECFFLCQRNREVPFWNPFDVIDIVTIGIGSTLPTRYSTTRCRAYPVTENCRSDLSLTNGNLVNEISRQDARNVNIL